MPNTIIISDDEEEDNVCLSQPVQVVVPMTDCSSRLRGSQQGIFSTTIDQPLHFDLNTALRFNVRRLLKPQDSKTR
jgi:hypothetical protein